MANYLDNIASLFERQFADAFIKEAVLGALSTKQIVFRPLTEKISGVYQDVKVDNGKLVIGCMPGMFLILLCFGVF